MAKTLKATKAQIKKAQAVLKAYCEKEGHNPFGIENSPIVDMFRHPVFKDMWGVVVESEWAYILEGDLGPTTEVTEAPDTWYRGDDNSFLEVTLEVRDGDLGFTYPGEAGEDGIFFTCYDKWDEKRERYAPSKFKEGETVYPYIFHPNVPGGWSVANKDRSITEYFQC